MKIVIVHLDEADAAVLAQKVRVTWARTQPGSPKRETWTRIKDAIEDAPTMETDDA